MVKSNTCETGESRNEKDEKIWNLRHEIIVNLPGHINRIIKMTECVQENYEVMESYDLRVGMSKLKASLSEFMEKLEEQTKDLDKHFFKVFGMRVFPSL